MRAIFIADAHLRHPGDDNYRRMLSFLAGLPGRTERLIILGDFFEFWLGDSPSPFPHYLPLLDALRRLTQQGVELVFLEGNHDFHLESYFRKEFHARVFPGPTILTMDGRRLCLCHGDQINRRDYSYLLLRTVFHGPLTRWLSRVVPASVPAGIAVWLGNRSKSTHAAAPKWDYPRLLRSFAAGRFAAGCDVVVTGHFHIPLLETSGGKTLLALGDWISQYSYGEWCDGDLTLKEYR